MSPHTHTRLANVLAPLRTRHDHHAPHYPPGCAVLLQAPRAPRSRSSPSHSPLSGGTQPTQTRTSGRLRVHIGSGRGHVTTGPPGDPLPGGRDRKQRLQSCLTPGGEDGKQRLQSGLTIGGNHPAPRDLTPGGDNKERRVASPEIVMKRRKDAQTARHNQRKDATKTTLEDARRTVPQDSARPRRGHVMLRTAGHALHQRRRERPLLYGAPQRHLPYCTCSSLTTGQ